MMTEDSNNAVSSSFLLDDDSRYHLLNISSSIFGIYVHFTEHLKFNILF